MEDTFEKEILKVSKKAVQKALLDSLTGYSSPLNNYAKEIVQEHSEDFKGIMREGLNKTFSSPKFKDLILEEFQRKVAKSLVGKLEGAVEKAANSLRQDPRLKAEMILAIENIVNENI